MDKLWLEILKLDWERFERNFIIIMSEFSIEKKSIAIFLFFSTIQNLLSLVLTLWMRPWTLWNHSIKKSCNILENLKSWINKRQSQIRYHAVWSKCPTRNGSKFVRVKSFWSTLMATCFVPHCFFFSPGRYNNSSKCITEK